MTPLISIGNAKRTQDWFRQEGGNDASGNDSNLNPIGACGLRKGDADDLDLEDEGPSACALGQCPAPPDCGTVQDDENDMGGGEVEGRVAPKAGPGVLLIADNKNNGKKIKIYRE